MSTNNTIRLHDINVPALNSVGYADGLNAAFNAIEDNMSILANSDLWKGDMGDSVNIEKIDLTEHTELLDALKTAIKGENEPNPINGVEWDSLLNTELYVINKTEIVNGLEVVTPVSSLYYTFIDGRFVNSRVGTLTSDDFGSEIDLSCILVYDEGEFKRLNNIFPTMYFENGYGLCWMVNGQRTGLPVQGVPGKDGSNSDILIVKVTSVDENGNGTVEQSWSKNGGWSDIDDKASIDGYSCFALAPNEDGATAFYIGKLIFEDDVLYVLCKPELSLQQTFDTQVFVNVMQNISIKSNSDTITTPPGLFVPMKTLGDLERDESGNVIEAQPVHLMSATSINNEQGNKEELMTDMVVTPVNTTDLVLDSMHDVKVDKYLYVKMSDELLEYLSSPFAVSKSVLKEWKLKYKLSNIVLSPNIQRPWTNDDTKVKFQRDDTFDNNGHILMENVVDFDDYNRLIPNDFLSNIDAGVGIFQWELDLTKDSFDPDNTIHNEVFVNGLELLNKAMPVIYTKTMTPGLGDDILWFNGVFVDNDDFYADYGEDTSNTPNKPANAAIYGYVYDDIDGPIVGATVSISEFNATPQPQYGQTDVDGFYSIVLTDDITSSPGWRDYIYGRPCHLTVNAVGYGKTTDIPIGEPRNDFKYDGIEFVKIENDDTIPDTETEKYKLLRGVDRNSLIFNKFIPMYVNDYRMDRDTSYNLNYNVNIMGDEENPKRTLSVFGDINCENINVYELTATGEIKNIYTKEEIVGESGISLAKGAFKVADDGSLNNEVITTKNVITEDVISDTTTTGSFRIVNGDDSVVAIDTKDTDSNSVDIDFNNVNEFSITGIKDNPSTVNSNIPIILDRQSGLYITDSVNILPFKGKTIKKDDGNKVIVYDLKSKFDYYATECSNSFNKNASSNKLIYNDLNNYCGARKSSFDSIKSAFKTTYIQFGNPSGYVSSFTFNGNNNNESLLNITHTTNIENSQDLCANIIKNQACCSFKITNPEGASIGGEVSFTKPFAFAVSMNSSCSNANWPVLKTSHSDTFVKFRVIAYHNNKYTELTDIKTNNTTYDGVCKFKNDLSWNGYEQTLKSGVSRWKEYVRTITFYVKPKNFTFDIPSDMSNTGKDIIIYIVPTVSMRLECQDSRKLIDYITCSKFIPYTASVSDDKVYNLDISTNPDTIIFTNKSLTTSQKNAYSLNCNYASSSSYLYSMNVDSDGILYAGMGGVYAIGAVDNYQKLGISWFPMTPGSCGDGTAKVKTMNFEDIYTVLAQHLTDYTL